MERTSGHPVDIHAFAPEARPNFQKLWAKDREDGALKILDHCCPNTEHGETGSPVNAPSQSKTKTPGWNEESRPGFCRILSICAENSVSPFGIKEDEIMRILQQHSVPSTFLDIMLAFGGKPSNGAAGSAQSAIHRRGGSDFDIQYNLSYVELAEGGREEDIRHWTTRQIGVYQHFVASDDAGFCLLLQCQKNSRAQDSIERLKCESDGELGKCSKLLFDIHTAILSTYFQNWQIYLTVLNHCFEIIARQVFTIQWDDPGDYADGQEQLQRLNLLQDRIFLFSPRLEATIEVIQTVETLGGSGLLDQDDVSLKSSWRPRIDELDRYKSRTTGLLRSAKSIEQRMECINKLLLAALNLRHQATGVENSGGVLKLTTAIGDDSAAVRVITFVTLLYMPATFVATLLGTNLFVYSAPQPSADFQISRKFWVYIILAVPLTILTVGYWLFYTKREKHFNFAKSANRENGKIQRNQRKWLNMLASYGVISRGAARKGRDNERLEGP